ncbi:RDD family protein [Salinisphaera aquimarina]|uniref:RDD family protein n=1 Tax=Salinisphaera aquimarina TaxID=2094031 RepID=A0ABV7ETG9_9GAMM
MPLSPYPAGLLRRLAASVYDLFLLVGLWLISGMLLLPFHQGQAVDGHSPWVRLYFLFIPYLFFSWFWMHGGQTLGMKAWRIRLRATDGGPVQWYQAVLRYAAAWVSWLSIVGMLWCLFDGQRRCLQDIVSNTEVVAEPKDD